jgi:uncharacterized RDD family membrane protein YckC
MADVSQGPGWWIASDGKWYPPHLHPSVRQAPPPPEPNVAASPAPASTPPAWGHGQTAGVPWTSPTPSVTYPPGYGPPPGYGAPPGTVLVPVAYNSNPGVQLDQVLRLPLSPWWKRFLAFLVDSMILGVAFFVILVVIAAAASRGSNSSSTNNHPLTPGQAVVGFTFLFILASIPFLLYYGIMNGSKRGQTLGKMALSIAVRDARTGGPIGFWRGVGRYAITIVFYLVLFIPYLIDNLSPLWDTRRQAWHDKVVHSVVVDRNA